MAFYLRPLINRAGPWGWPLALALFILLTPLAARSQEDEAEQIKMAEVHLEMGKEHFKNQEYLFAIKELQESYRLNPVADVQVYLGLAYEAEGFIGRAHQLLSACQPADAKEQRLVKAALKRIDKDLKSNYVPCQFITNPEGAVVWLDGKLLNPLGQAPFTFPISQERHEVIAEKEGYRPAKGTVAGEKDKECKVNLSLEMIPVKVPPPPKSYLSVRTGVEGAQVTVDGASLGEGLAVGPVELKPGKHSIDVAQKGYQPWSREVEIAVGQTAEILADLVALTPERNYWWGIATAGSSLLFAGVGLGLNLAAGGDASDLDDCLGACEIQRMQDIRSAGEGKVIGSYVLYGLAGAALVAGAALLIWPPESRPWEAEQPQQGLSRLTISF